ncbi:MAG TPA: OmpH family outer membrane protein [Rhodospirillales bacterium]
MKQVIRLSLAAALGLLLSVGPALSQQAKPAQNKAEQPAKKDKIVEVQIPIPFATIDVLAILRDAAAVKDIRDQINKYGTKYEAEIEKERNEIRDANQELARQRTVLSPEAFAEKRRQFEQRVVDVQRLVQQRQRDLDKSRNDAMSKVNDAYMKIVSTLAAERSLAVILRKDQTAFATPALDVTSNVLTRLDKELPKVTVAEPGKDAPDKKAAKPGK